MATFTQRFLTSSAYTYITWSRDQCHFRPSCYCVSAICKNRKLLVIIYSKYTSSCNFHEAINFKINKLLCVRILVFVCFIWNNLVSKKKYEYKNTFLLLLLPYAFLIQQKSILLIYRPWLQLLHHCNANTFLHLFYHFLRYLLIKWSSYLKVSFQSNSYNLISDIQFSCT
jgi:hypothetical protein